MSLRNCVKDVENLRLTFTVDFAAPVDTVWRVWEDPKLLGRWWGPPTYPATFVSYGFEVGGRAHYFMEGPTGDRHYGGWIFTALQPKQGLALDDYFADETGTPNDALPGTSMTMALTSAGGQTTMTLVSQFGSLEQLEQLAAMGMVEGMSAALGQIDALLVELGAAG